MNVCIFAGPTLPPGDAARTFPGTWLPPARHGDVFRAVELLRPGVIGIVDGYFQWVPSVRHQEILWAIAQGVHVFGAASMGALRAAELAAFGMHGVGRIFEGYRSGRLEESGDEPFEDDDEVAVVHGPAESGYLAVSEAMVNIRCTLAAAERKGAITGTTRARMVGLAKRLYFPDRTYDRLLALAREAACPVSEIDALRAWLPEGRVNQKRADAVAMLDTMRAFVSRDPAPARARFTFEHTTLWQRGFEGAPVRIHDDVESAVLAELRMSENAWESLRDRLTDAATSAEGDAEVLAAALAAHANHPEEIERLLECAQREAAARRMRDTVSHMLAQRQMLARLRETGEYTAWSARAEDKRRQLSSSAADVPGVDDFSGLQLLQLRDWFFTHVRGEDMPEDLDGYLKGRGYEDESQFHGELIREFAYRQMTDGAKTDPHGRLAGMEHGQ
ncbi:MAG TPA: TfuA-like protein [Burkholderiales bacterium]|nr:TfuA-like protein [Burkholderiales bacterium]